MTFKVMSDSFADGDYLPKDHILSADFGFGCAGGNRSPHLNRTDFGKPGYGGPCPKATIRIDICSRSSRSATSLMSIRKHRRRSSASTFTSRPWRKPRHGVVETLNGSRLTAGR